VVMVVAVAVAVAVGGGGSGSGGGDEEAGQHYATVGAMGAAGK
jgi:hypothetical protein